MGTRARIGFHAARISLEDQELASGANVVVGAYLFGLGVTDLKSIIYLTSASPQAMRWLLRAMARGVTCEAIAHLEQRAADCCSCDWISVPSVA